MSDDRWRVLSSIVPTLKIFYGATQGLTSEKEPTLSCVGSVNLMLLSKCELEDDDSDALIELKKELQKGIMRRHSIDAQGSPVDVQLHFTQYLASFLDSR